MKSVLVFTGIFFGVSSLLAQDATITNLKTEAGKTISKDPNDTLSKVWKTGGTFSFNLAQG